jgi:hypothetical protein
MGDGRLPSLLRRLLIAGVSYIKNSLAVPTAVAYDVAPSTAYYGIEIVNLRWVAVPVNFGSETHTNGGLKIDLFTWFLIGHITSFR